ncbi:hypothetical protein D3C72_1751970 [compost metagenome]
MAFKSVARIHTHGGPGDPGQPGAQTQGDHPTLPPAGLHALQAVERGGEDFVGQQESHLQAVVQRGRQKARQQRPIEQMAGVEQRTQRHHPQPRRAGLDRRQQQELAGAGIDQHGDQNDLQRGQPGRDAGNAEGHGHGKVADHHGQAGFQAVDARAAGKGGRGGRSRQGAFRFVVLRRAAILPTLAHAMAGPGPPAPATAISDGALPGSDPG